MDIFTKRTVFDKIPEQLSDLAKEYQLEEVEQIEKGAVIPEKELEMDIEERTVVKYISAISVDRDGDIILPDGGQMDDYRKHPTVLYAHRHGADMFGGGEPTLPVGKAVWIKADKFGVKAKIKFAKNDLANAIFEMYKDGFPLASSIGFIPLEGVRNDGSREWKETVKYVKTKYGMSTKDINSAKQIFTKWYLLEDSEVPVPANQDALALAFKNGTFKCKSVDLLKDLELEDQKDKIKIEELEKALELAKERNQEIVTGNEQITIEHENEIAELNMLNANLEEKMRIMKAEKPKFTKKDAQTLIKASNKQFLDHIDKLMGKV